MRFNTILVNITSKKKARIEENNKTLSKLPAITMIKKASSEKL